MEITLLYTSLITILAIFLAFKVGITRGKTNTLLGEGDSSELLQSIRSHGNLMESAPITLILLLLLEMQSVATLCISSKSKRISVMGALSIKFPCDLID